MAGAELLVRRVFGSNSTRNFLSDRMPRKESLASATGRVSREGAAPRADWDGKTGEPPIPTGGAAVSCCTKYMTMPDVTATAAMPAIKVLWPLIMAMTLLAVVAVAVA